MSVATPTIRRMQATAELTPAQRRTLEGLIGTDERPMFPVDAVLRLRDRIEEAARAFELPDALWLGKSNLTDLARCPGLFDAVRAGERGPFAFSARSAAGRLAHKAIELEVAGARSATRSSSWRSRPSGSVRTARSPRTGAGSTGSSATRT